MGDNKLLINAPIRQTKDISIQNKDKDVSMH